MELKKSSSADIEKKRLTGFLLGLVFALALLVVSFEYTSNNSSDDNSDELLDDLSQDIEMISAVEQKDMIALSPRQSTPVITEKMNEVKENPALEELNKDKLNGDATLTEEGITAEQEDDKSNAVAQDETAGEDNSRKLRVVEELPEFPGGMVEFMKWLTKNLKYPELAKQQKIQGKVVVSFIVNKDGSTANAKIIKSVDPLLDREALRIIRIMPKWKPGTDKGKVCRTMICIPIVFRI